MKKSLIFALVLSLIFCGASFAEEAIANKDSCSLLIVEDTTSRLHGQRKTVVEINSKTAKTQKFLSELWFTNRRLFKDAVMDEILVDSSYQEIVFVCGEQKLAVRSYHRLWEENPKLVATSRGGISLLDKTREGRTREDILSEDEKWYLDFRKGFDNIFNAAITFKE